MELSEEIKTIATITRHQKLVSHLLRKLARELENRADIHDLSKFQLDELEGFIEVNQVARKYPFGSDEYKKSLKNNKAIELHFSRNSHHPEYHIQEVESMELLDFVEMTIDWIAANKIYGNTPWGEALKRQEERFNLSNCHMTIINLIENFYRGE